LEGNRGGSKGVQEKSIKKAGKSRGATGKRHKIRRNQELIQWRGKERRNYRAMQKEGGRKKGPDVGKKKARERGDLKKSQGKESVFGTGKFAAGKKTHREMAVKFVKRRSNVIKKVPEKEKREKEERIQASEVRRNEDSAPTRKCFQKKLIRRRNGRGGGGSSGVRGKLGCGEG